MVRVRRAKRSGPDLLTRQVENFFRMKTSTRDLYVAVEVFDVFVRIDSRRLTVRRSWQSVPTCYAPK
jgi:hypothetical protein